MNNKKPHKKIYRALIALALLHLSSATYAMEYEQCLVNAISAASDDLTIGEIKKSCTPYMSTKTNNTTIATSEDKKTVAPEKPHNKYDDAFSLLPYKNSYIIYSHYTHPNNKVYSTIDDASHQEIKFQISIKSKIWDGILNSSTDLYFGYSQTSFWQALNSSNSNPFRESNYEPEIWLEKNISLPALPIDKPIIRLGLNHQSNGRGVNLSRSWNRVYSEFLFSKGNFDFSIKPWWRIPEKQKRHPLSVDGDDNPDIEKYLGYGEFTTTYTWANDAKASLLLRNNLRKDNKGAVQIDYSFPINNRIRLYMLLFNGYGESLIDYDESTTRVGIGFMINDWTR